MLGARGRNSTNARLRSTVEPPATNLRCQRSNRWGWSPRALRKPPPTGPTCSLLKVQRPPQRPSSGDGGLRQALSVLASSDPPTCIGATAEPRRPYAARQRLDEAARRDKGPSSRMATDKKMAALPSVAHATGTPSR